MKSGKTATLSGCVALLIAFCILGSCLLPFGLVVGGITSTVSADFVAQTLGPYMCPQGSVAQVHTFETTSRDASGFENAATGYEVRCVNPAGELVKDLGPTVGFAWTGILAVASLLVALLLAFLFASSVGALVAKLRSRNSASPPA
jgi:hypothetical protein